MEQNIQQKDAWDVAYKNLVQISYLGVFASLALMIAYAMNFEQANILLITEAVVVTGVWYYLAQMFKKRDKKTISSIPDIRYI